VLLVGASLGAIRGALSLTVYVGLGTLGLPIFSGGSSGPDVITGGTGGFLIGFIVAAALAGWLAQRRWDRRFLTGVASLAAASAVTFAIGLPWLGVWLGQNGLDNDLPAVLAAGLYPFILGELVKVLLAALILRLIWRGVARTETQHPDDPE
jgi:biotin transport system substrate-specific component